MTDSNGHQNLVTIDLVAQAMQVSERTVQRWVANEEIPFHRIGGTLRFNLEEVLAASRRGPEVVVVP